MTPRPHIPLILLALLLIGCKSAPTPAPTPAAETTSAAAYPPRPTIPRAAFKIFHHANSTFTLTVSEKATDDEISALVWQLRDAARTRSFDTIKIPQKEVDADGSNVWFHIYRGAKCAPEKYAPGEPPCGGSYHASGDYTWVPQPKPWDKGQLNPGQDHPTDLWDSEAPYTPPANPPTTH
jgi:hypothetical protein